MTITGKVVGDTITTSCGIEEPEDYSCGPCHWEYRGTIANPGAPQNFEINKFVLTVDGCGNSLNANPWCKTCVNPMDVYSNSELVAILKTENMIQTGCLQEFDKNRPAPEPPVSYELCGSSTCDCTWKLKWVVDPTLGQTSMKYWDCVSNCGDGCNCAEPMVLIKGISGEIIEEPAVGRWMGDTAKSACKPAAKISTQANLNRDQITMGYGYESMPMGLDTTIDVNGNSMQLTSYVSFVNGQGQMKITSYSEDGTLLNLNIESLDSISGIVKMP
jgi:hypothetical protein